MNRLMTLGDFRRATKDLGDDFKLQIRIRRRLTDEELKNMPYPYPYATENIQGIEFDDVGYSDKDLCLGVEVSRE